MKKRIECSYKVLKDAFNIFIQFLSGVIGLINFVGSIAALVLLYKLYPSILLKYLIILNPAIILISLIFGILIYVIMILAVIHVSLIIIDFFIGNKKEVSNGKGTNRRKTNSRTIKR